MSVIFEEVWEFLHTGARQRHSGSSGVSVPVALLSLPPPAAAGKLRREIRALPDAY